MSSIHLNNQLLDAAANGELHEMRDLLDRGADVNARNLFESTPLILCSSQHDPEFLRLLIDRGADIDAKNRDGVDALIRAASSGRLESVRLLLDRGADLSCRNHRKEPVLTVAAAQGHADVVRLLLDQGAGIEEKDRSGRTALTAACNLVRSASRELVTAAVAVASSMPPGRDMRRSCSYCSIEARTSIAGTPMAGRL
jgi:ankyrin repeat protein